MTPRETLELLRDIPGVAGSCLLDPNATVLVRDLPLAIDDKLLAAIGPRAAAVLTAVSQPMPGATGVVLRFARLSVFCTRAGRNLLVLLCAPDTSAASVKAAMNTSALALARVVEADSGRDADATSDRPPRRGTGIWG